MLQAAITYITVGTFIYLSNKHQLMPSILSLSFLFLIMDEFEFHPSAVNSGGGGRFQRAAPIDPAQGLLDKSAVSSPSSLRGDLFSFPSTDTADSDSWAHISSHAVVLGALS